MKPIDTGEDAPIGVEDIARLANQFFRALPGGSDNAEGVTARAPNIAASPPASAAPQRQADLYVLAEALEQKQAREAAANPNDFTRVNADLMPGAEYTNALLAPLAVPRAPATFAQGGSTAHLAHARAVFDIEAVRRDFPILHEKINGRTLIWLDNAATTHKPQAVIDRLAYFYAHENSNIHRAAHTLAARATEAYENARKIVARFIGASSPDEIVFVRGGTEAINLVAQSWGRRNIGAGDEIIVSHLEHHANIVPWQLLAKEVGARLRVIPVDDSGQILLDEYERLLSDKTKLVAITHVSNALGTIVPIQAVIDRAHAAGAKVLIDGAQSIAHKRINVAALDADFFVFSGHKIFAPTGIGALYAKRDLLDAMPPWQGGGNMIADVTFEKTAYKTAPARFEAGTGNLADAVALGEALDYIDSIGLERIEAHEHDLLAFATGALLAIPGLNLFGTAREKASVLSFTLDGVEPHEIGAALDRRGIAVRAGHHCAQPILRRFGVEETVRASLALYNTKEDVSHLVEALRDLAPRRRRS